MQGTSGLPLASPASRAQAQAHDQLAQSQSLSLVLPNRTVSPPQVEKFNPDAHPEDPFRTKHQRRMMDAFITHRRWGLRREILEEAKRQWALVGNGNENNSWYSIIEDEEKVETRYTLQLLMLLPDCIIKSLIQNTLAYDSTKQKEVRAFVNRHMMAHISYAGMYVKIPTRSLPPGSLALTGVTDEQGRFLSSDEVGLLIKRVERYVANEPADYAENSRVDNFYKDARATASDPDKRSFGGSVTKWREWLDVMRKQYRTGIPPTECSTQFRACSMEVGYSQDIPKRLKAHITNSGTTAIFRVVNAMTRQPAAHEGFAFPEPWQPALFPIWKRDPTLARVAEVVGSVLCSSYWHYGGLNISEAGYSNITSATPTYDHAIWEQSIRETDDRLTEYGLADEELQFWLTRAKRLEGLQELPESKRKAEEVEQKFKDVQAKRESIRMAMGEVKKDIERLQSEIKAQRTQNDHQQRLRAEGDDIIESGLSVLEACHEERVQVNDEIDRAFGLGSYQDKPSDDAEKPELSDAAKARLAQIEERIRQRKEMFYKKREAEKASASTATTQDDSHGGSQGYS